MSEAKTHPFSWINRISLGEVIQVVTIVGVFAVWFFGIDARIKLVEQQNQQIVQRLDRDDEATQRQLSQILIEIRTLRSELRQIERDRP